MTQYSSREPFEHGEWWGYPDGWVVDEVPQTNPTNPVLTKFRERDFPAGYWVHRLGKGDAPVGVEATSEQINHARRVLTRLANLKEES